jgi:hypothetical protein
MLWFDPGACYVGVQALNLPCQIHRALSLVFLIFTVPALMLTYCDHFPRLLARRNSLLQVSAQRLQNLVASGNEDCSY